MRRIAIGSILVSMLVAPARAGDVTVTVENGTLHLVGGGGNENITVDQIGVADAEQFHVTAGAGTTVNGSGGTHTFDDVKKDLRVELGTGIDSLLVDGAEFGRDLVFIAGSGGMFTLDMRATRAKGDLRLTSQGQRTQADVQRSIVRGDVRVDGGDDLNQFVFGPDSVLHGDARFSGGDSSDFVQVDRSLVRGDVTLSPSLNGDTLSIRQSIVSGDVRMTDDDGIDSFDLFDSRIEGSARASLGGDNDEVAVQCGEVLRGVKADGGAGSNSFFMNDARVDRKLDWRATGGSSNVTILGSSVVDGNAAFRLGTGPSEFEINGCAVNGKLLIDGGNNRDFLDAQFLNVLGDAQLAFGGTTGIPVDEMMLVKCSFGGSFDVTASGKSVFAVFASHSDERMRFALGDHENSVQLSTVLAPQLEIRTGAAADEILLQSDTLIDGNLSIRAGDGTNLITLFQAVVGGNSSVKAGSGDDTLTLNQFIVAGKEKVDLGGGNNIES